MSSSGSPTQSPSISPLAAYGIYQGATSGNPVGQTRAGLGAAKLYGNLSGDSALSTGAGAAMNGLGIYSGLQQGGWQGDTRAAASGMQLAGGLLGSSALSDAGGAMLIPLDLYNEIQSYQSGNTASDAMSGAETGAAIGSVIPVVGTAVGGIVGGALGALASAFGPGETDPETQNVQHLIDYTGANAQQNNPNAAESVQNPYLQLAGLMDERSSTLPEYQQYGRMGEQKFANDLAGQLNNAVSSGQLGMNPDGSVTVKNSEGQNMIFSGDNAGKIAYDDVVAPWVNKMGSGYNNVGQTYANVNSGLIEDMTNQYLHGQAAQDWKPVGGQDIFSGIYNNSPLQPEAQAYTAQQQAAQQAATNQASLRQNSGLQRGLAYAAQGGHMTKKTSVLDKIRSSFQDVQHYDDGGSVYDSNNLYFTPTNYGSSAYDFNLSTPSSTDVSGSDIQQTNQQGVDTINNPYGGSGALSGSSSGLGGILSSLGMGSVGSALKNYGALAPIIAAALGGGSKSASAPATPQGFTSGTTSPTLPSVNYNRTYTQPNVQNWYTYGQGPEQSFYSNNRIPQVAGVTPGATPSSTGATGTVPYMANTQPVNPLRPSTMAHGGTFNSPAGDDYVPDPGHGDGTSDDIDAKLSGGEYVMDAGTVSMLGNGSNEAGARALDQLRERVRKHAGKHLVKGKQFMKAKAPDAYLQGGKS